MTDFLGQVVPGLWLIEPNREDVSRLYYVELMENPFNLLLGKSKALAQRLISLSKNSQEGWMAFIL